MTRRYESGLVTLPFPDALLTLHCATIWSHPASRDGPRSPAKPLGLSLRPCPARPGCCVRAGGRMAPPRPRTLRISHGQRVALA